MKWIKERMSQSEHKNNARNNDSIVPTFKIC